MRDDWNELVKEARTKIRPVLMSEEDREKYIEPMENFQRDVGQEDRNTLLVDIDRRAHLFLQAENISLEIVKKIQDKKMEIDIEYEKTRDLYEK